MRTMVMRIGAASCWFAALLGAAQLQPAFSQTAPPQAAPPQAAPPQPSVMPPASPPAAPPLVQLAPLPQSVPEKVPFDLPYGAPITLSQARPLVAASLGEAAKRGWKMACAVADPHGETVAFERMDDTQLPSTAIAIGKARTAARWRRDTRVFFKFYDSGKSFYGVLDPQLTPVPGGLPLVEDGKIIGAIGCSGGNGDQDEIVAKAGLAALQPR